MVRKQQEELAILDLPGLLPTFTFNRGPIFADPYHSYHHTDPLRDIMRRNQHQDRVNPGPGYDKVEKLKGGLWKKSRWEVVRSSAIPGLGRDSKPTYKTFPSNPSCLFYSLLIYKFPSISPYFLQFLLPHSPQVELSESQPQCYKVDCPSSF